MNIAQRLILHEAIETFGSQNQYFKAIEETAELNRALVRHIANAPDEGQEHNFDNLIEEIADVQIMIEQIIIINNIHRQVQLAKEYKIKNLQETINSHKQQNQ